MLRYEVQDRKGWLLMPGMEIISSFTGLLCLVCSYLSLIFYNIMLVGLLSEKSEFNMKVRMLDPYKQ